MGTADEIEKLHALHERGVITAEEFAAGKAKLLAADAAPAGRPARRIDPARAAKAKRLVNVSHALGWGGIGVAFGVGPVLIGVAGAGWGVFAIVVGVSCAIAGAIVGQVGRALQGRAI